MRGFAPSEVPSAPMTLMDLVADANGLHEALGGGSDAVVIGHDWGAMTAWGAAMHGKAGGRRSSAWTSRRSRSSGGS